MRTRFFLTMQVVAILALAFSAGCGGSKQPTIHAKPMPEGGSFTGVWFSPQYGEMHLRQSGSSAIGRYSKDERVGRLQGSVEGDIMRFEWKEKRELIVGRAVETKGHGYFRLIRDDAEDTWKLVGEWGNDAEERGGGPWNAVKSKTRKPEIDEGGNDAEPSPTPSSSGGDSSDFGGRDVSEPKGSDDLSDL